MNSVISDAELFAVFTKHKPKTLIDAFKVISAEFDREVNTQTIQRIIVIHNRVKRK